jgi:replicative DNA helicase
MTAIETKALSNGMPAATEAEKWLLGSIILAGYLLPEAQALRVQDFAVEADRRIFAALRALDDLGRPIDDLTVYQHLSDRGELESVGGASAIAALTSGLPHLANIGEYVRIVRDKADARRIVEIANAAATAAIDGQPPADVVRTLEARLDALKVGDAAGADAYTVDALHVAYQEHADRIDEKLLTLGLPKFDEVTGGVGPGEVVDILSRTMVGKSAFAQNAIQHVLDAHPDAGVIFFSLEMPRVQAWERALQIFAGVHRDVVLHSYRNATGLARADEFRERYSGRLLICDDASLDLAGIRRFVRGAVAAKLVSGLRLIVIDYLGLLDHGGKASLTERISVIAREVKQTAKQLNVAILLIAQTSRSAGDGSEEVTVTDARDSGAVEDSADFLLGAWRPELRKGLSADEYANVAGQLWFSILKNRRGPRARFVMEFDGPTLRVMEPRA